MSTLSTCSPNSAWASLGEVTTAASSFIRSLLNKVQQPSKARTASVLEQEQFERPASMLIEAFVDAKNEAHQNPEQAEPNEASLMEAISLLEMLPNGLESPEPVIEPSGAVAWVWDRGDGRFLVLAVNGTGRIERSAVIDGVESSGKSALSDRLGPEEHRLLKHFRLTHG